MALCLSASQLAAICQRRDRLLSSVLYDASRSPLVEERREALACRGDDVHEALALR